MVRSGLPMSFESGLAAYEVGSTIAATQLNNGLIVIEGVIEGMLELLRSRILESLMDPPVCAADHGAIRRNRASTRPVFWHASGGCC